MEGVGDRTFRKAMASIGGFDEAVRDFLRVPRCGHVKSLAVAYDPNELAPIPLSAQIMGSEPELMADMAKELEQRGAPRIDVNCGCPSNMVTGKGAGSSLLREPDLLHKVVKAVVKAVSIPVTLKMRSGYDDISLFQENLLAGQESGVRYITLHPRTKADGYGPPARWDLIAAAKQFLKIPLVGNGDIRTPQDAIDMLEATGCDGLMIGRGSIMNPFLFHQIRARFSNIPFTPKWEDLLGYFRLYCQEIASKSSPKQQVGKMKQLLSFYCKGSPELMEKRQMILSSEIADLQAFFAFVQPILKVSFATHST
jgi:tRNA-dihydrouridine synthase C